MNGRWTILIFFVLIGCVEPFEPVIPGADRQFIVVDGVITDQPGPYIIKLTRTVPLDAESSKGEAINNASVQIESSDGEIEVLRYVGPGEYATNGLQGRVGLEYQLTFALDGLEYQSSWETIEESSEIDSVSYDRLVDIGSGEEGLQFYVNNSGKDSDSRYYRYEWDETWRITVEYRALYDYLGDDKVAFTTNPLYDCWKFDTARTINLATTEGLVDNVLFKHKIPFVFGNDERFTQRYSLNVKQYSLDEEEYAFWNLLQESNQEGGSLFDKQPANVSGNIKNISNPGDVVLGYFSASSLKEERVFLRQITELSPRLSCAKDPEFLFKSELGPVYESRLLDLLEQGFIFYQVITVPQVGVVGSIVTTPPCSDCRTKGGDLNKPDYWDE